MKQKIVIKVAMTCDKCRSKVMSLVAATSGVDSVSLAGDDRDQVVVVGDGVDSVRLTRKLRKKVRHAELVQVADAAEKKKEETKKKEPDAGAAKTKKKDEEEKKPADDAAVTLPAYPWPYPYQYCRPCLPPVGILYCDEQPENACTIL